MYAEMRGLRLVVDVAEDGWRYRIWSGEDLIAEHQPVYPFDQSLEGAQLSAVTKALSFLESAEDPTSESLALHWQPL